MIEERILIHTPKKRDAELACEVLEQSGLYCTVCPSMEELVQELRVGGGAVLAMEEALPTENDCPLRNYLSTQPPWSDLPILVLTKPGGASPWVQGAFERLGNLTLLERPVRTPTLVSAARSALRARQRQYELRLADRRKDEFLAMLAHELRNPLAPIRSASQLLQWVSADPEKVRQSSEIITRQVSHMTNLIDDLLDVARVTRGMVELHKEVLDMRDVLTEAVEQVSPLIRLRQHRLALDLGAGPVPVYGDRHRLIQILVNLLNNAAKYTPEGGQLQVSLATDGDGVNVDVEDNGIGLAPELLPQVFDLFSQAERTSDRSQGGLGLGLALVRSLAQLHGGSVQASSAGPGYGSRFRVRLPCAIPSGEPAQQVRREEPSFHQVPSPQRLEVLVVDDNVDAATALQMFLQMIGHAAVIETTAGGALQRALQARPQVCLLDIGLPDFDGYELARRLRRMPQTCGLTLIALTGYGQEQDIIKAKEAGFDQHFVKPVNMARLAELLRSVACR